MKSLKLILFVLLLLIKTSLVFSQVTVMYKISGVYKKFSYKSYEDCGCKIWAVDFYKNGADKSWGMSTNANREQLEAEIKKDIDNDYNIWHRVYSDHCTVVNATPLNK